MEKSRLVQLLRTLDAGEWRALKKFAASPYFNQRKEVSDLLQLLEKPLLQGEKLPDKELVFRHLFGKGTFDDHRVRMAMSFSLRLVEQFWVVQHATRETTDYYLQLATIYRERQLPEHFRRQHAYTVSMLEATPLRNADFYENRYRLGLEKHRFELGRQEAADLQLQRLSDELDHAFLARKLWQACFMLAHQALSNEQYDFGILAPLLSGLATSPALHEPAIAIYYHCFMALTHPAHDDHFQAFKSALFAHAELFPADERRDLYILAINFCTRRYNAGNSAYLREQFELYREGLAKAYFLTDGALTRYTYLNAATVGLVLNELDWTADFIETYRHHLPAPQQTGLYSFNAARLAYRRGQPGPALVLLQKAEYKDLMLNLAAKVLQLKIFYESGEYDLLESHLQAIRMFIRRKKVMGYHRENYLNVVYFTQKLLEIPAFDRAARQALYEEIAAARAVAEKDWLLEQVNRR